MLYNVVMFLLIHIVIALASVIFSTYSIFSPSDKKVTINYVFLGGTWISGMLLVLQSQVSFGHLCLSGILYTSVVALNIYLAKRRLSPQEAS